MKTLKKVIKSYIINLTLLAIVCCGVKVNAAETIVSGNGVVLNTGYNSITYGEDVAAAVDQYLQSTDYEEVDPYSMYVNAESGLRYRSVASTDSDESIIGAFEYGKEVTVIGEREDNWVAIKATDTESGIAYVCSDYLQNDKPITDTYNHNWTGEKLNSSNGIVAGPSGNETYYNLDMSFIVQRLHRLGYEGEYWVREDGVKMFGDYVMVAADFSIRPIGTILPMSLGTAIVCDTGGFVNWDRTRLDVATTW